MNHHAMAFRVPTEIWARVARATRESPPRDTPRGRGRAKTPERITAETAIGLGLLAVTLVEILHEEQRRGGSASTEILNLSGVPLRLARARGGNLAATVRASLTRGLDMMGVSA